jgi:primosomal protein N' (replication factor Y) (superfamily II helicase)
MYAEIIIPLALPKNYTWMIPPSMESDVMIGMRVEVMLGANKRYAGIIKKISDLKPVGFDPKPIIDILDEEPIVYEHQLKLWEWMAEYDMCSEGEVMQAAIPSHLKISSESIFILQEEANIDIKNLSDSEYIISEALEIKKELSLIEIQKLLNKKSVYPVVNKLIQKGICIVQETMRDKFTIKSEIYITLHSDYREEVALKKLLNSWSRAPKQLDLLLSFLHFQKTEGEVSQKAILAKANASHAQLKALIEKGVLVTEKRKVGRLALDHTKGDIHFHALTPSQSNVLQDIQTQLETQNVSLLHGITGSGKTQIYVSLINEVIKQGKQALYMLPEIALTAQMIRRLKQYFGGSVAIYHSKFNPNERVEIWNKVKSGEIKIVLGARSALFLPYKNLSLIVIDEEHDPSYKQQEPAPRYQARDTAIYYANQLNAKVVLGSATPSVETFYNAKSKKFGYTYLNERFSQASLPKIELVDTKKQPANSAILTPVLLAEIKKTIENKKQVILFQNRRGYAPYFICETCGWIPHCKHCDVTLTYHKAKNMLSCHYCGTGYPIVNTCEACGKNSFKQKSFGTEQIEEKLMLSLPGVHVARMDYDNVKGKNEHDHLIQQFEQKQIDILVGTQMVVKGLDFENVDLVGIVDADSLLNFNHYRVNERAFQMMEQVSGRAGRKNDHGKVIIQVSQTQHPIVQYLKGHDYFAFYEFEIQNRKHFAYPPFSRLMSILFKHPDNHIAEEAALHFFQSLGPAIQKTVLGPAQPNINRVRNKYIWELSIKISKQPQQLKLAKQQLLHFIRLIQVHPRYKSVQIVIDIDPN